MLLSMAAVTGALLNSALWVRGRGGGVGGRGRHEGGGQREGAACRRHDATYSQVVKKNCARLRRKQGGRGAHVRIEDPTAANNTPFTPAAHTCRRAMSARSLAISQ